MTSLLQASNIWFSYDSKKYIIRGVSIAIHEGNIYMIFGRSGVGKTTLLKLLKGILLPLKGEIRYRGNNIENEHTRHEAYKTIGYIPQGFGVVTNLTVLENVVVGALSRVSVIHSLLGHFPEHELKKAEEILKILGIHDLRDVKVSKISGGQKQRVAIARALMQDPDIILADEFISQLDPVTSLEILDDFKKLAKEKKIGIVITTHDVQLVSDYADEVLVLKDGTIVFRAIKEMIDKDNLIRAMR